MIALAFALYSGCEEGNIVLQPDPVCRLNQFRRCDADCGRAVEQCIEPGPHWSECACTVLDGAPPVGDAASLDSGGPDDAGAEGRDAPDAADAADVVDDGAG